MDLTREKLVELQLLKSIEVDMFSKKPDHLIVDPEKLEQDKLFWERSQKFATDQKLQQKIEQFYTPFYNVEFY